MAHSRTISILYLLEPGGWLILELLVSSTCWSQCMAHSRAVSVPLYLLEPVHVSFQSCKRPLPAGVSRMTYSRAVSVLYLLEPF